MEKTDTNYIGNINYRAFETIRKYYDREVKANSIFENINHTIMIQIMLGKAKEIFEN